MEAANILHKKRPEKLLQSEFMIQTSLAKKDRHISSRLGPCIQASGKEDSVTALASKSGLMALNMLESGERIVLMEKANLFMLMAIFMMASGQMTRPTVLVFINM